MEKHGETSERNATSVRLAQRGILCMLNLFNKCCRFSFRKPEVHTVGPVKQFTTRHAKAVVEI